MSLSIMGCCFIRRYRIIYQSCLKCFMYFYTITNVTLQATFWGRKGSSKHFNRDVIEAKICTSCVITAQWLLVLETSELLCTELLGIQQEP